MYTWELCLKLRSALSQQLAYHIFVKRHHFPSEVSLLVGPVYLDNLANKLFTRSGWGVLPTHPLWPGTGPRRASFPGAGPLQAQQTSPQDKMSLAKGDRIGQKPPEAALKLPEIAWSFAATYCTVSMSS